MTIDEIVKEVDINWRVHLWPISGIAKYCTNWRNVAQSYSGIERFERAIDRHAMPRALGLAAFNFTLGFGLCWGAAEIYASLVT